MYVCRFMLHRHLAVARRAPVMSSWRLEHHAAAGVRSACRSIICMPWSGAPIAVSAVCLVPGRHMLTKGAGRSRTAAPASPETKAGRPICAARLIHIHIAREQRRRTHRPLLSQQPGGFGHPLQPYRVWFPPAAFPAKLPQTACQSASARPARCRPKSKRTPGHPPHSLRPTLGVAWQRIPLPLGARRFFGRAAPWN